MRRPRRKGARVLWLTITATLFAVALVLFPLKGRSAPAAPDAPSGAAAAGQAKAAKKGAKHAKAEAADAGVEDPPAPADEAAPPGPGAGAEEGPPSTIPLGKGLPVLVDVAVFFLEITSFDDTKGEFEAITDVRLRWNDPRLAASGRGLRGYRELLGKAAEEELEKMWTPNVDVKNRLETGSYVGRRLRVYPDGRVETITRTTSRLKTSVSTESFPFDRQNLPLELIVRDDTTDEVLLRFEKEDVEFSRAARDAKLDGWDIGLVDLSASAVAGWNGDRYSRVTATLFIDRQAASSIASVFIPLLASLLIPLLALWMNGATEDGFTVDAFELANMGIGGLFSVIALSFAIYSANPIIATSDNTVTRLFGLNYAMLALSLTIVVVFFRYEVPKRLFGPYVQAETFHFLAWATPLLSLATSIAFLLIAAA